jgi:diaminopimelate epimerase
MDIQFLKMQTCGKDFIILDGLNHGIPEEAGQGELAKQITDPHRGVGGIAFVIMHRGGDSKVAVKVFDAAGDETEPDPDALRCAGRLAFDSGLLGGKDNMVGTRSGPITLDAVDSRNITVDMGIPMAATTGEEIRESPEANLRQEIIVEGRGYAMTPIRVAGDHLVLFAADYDGTFPTLGRTISRNSKNADHAVLLQVYSRTEIKARIWKSGKGEILSASAPDGAGLVAAVLEGFTDRDVVVHNRGGDNYVNWNEGNNHLYATGPVEYVFMGTYYWETWEW